jgi:DNA-binding NarL/FixJ family response regulator
MDEVERLVQEKHDALVAAVEAARRGLDEAETTLAAFRARMVAKMGIATANKSAQAQRAERQRTVRSLVEEGLSRAEIVRRTGLPDHLVGYDIDCIRKRRKPQGTKVYSDGHEPEAGESPDDAEPAPPSKTAPSRPELPLRLPPQLTTPAGKRQRVVELVKAGKNAKQIAEEMDISVGSVYTHICDARKAGELPPVGTALAPAPTSEPSTAEGDDWDGGEGDSVEILRAELQRQQGGQKSMRVYFTTTVVDGHRHRAVVDRMGDGITEPDGTGHQHRVFRFVMGRMAKHGHGLRVAKAVA